MARIAHVIGNEWRSSDIETEEDRTFSSFLLSEAVLHGLKSAGFVKPSPIQYQAIPLGRCGLDLIVQAKSGTGKTCVFAVIALEKLLLQSKATQALVLAPTREVAVQICQVVNGLGCAFKGLKCHVFIGGMPISEDKWKLKHCHIAIGTPGRIKQLIRDGILITSAIRLFVLDEADKLLEEGFQESINWIYSSLPIRKQMLALSATYPEKLAELLELYMTNPALVRLNADRPALLGVMQFYMSTPHHSMQLLSFQAKVQALLKILKKVQFSQCIVFSNYQTRAESLCDALRKHNWPTDYISGGQEQTQRLHAIDKLKQFKCRVMVSTDLTSRGIDAENVNLVVNMDVPWDVETYLHRIGRAGRFGTRGLAVTFVSGEEETEIFQKIITKGLLQVSVLPDPLPPDLWSYASYREENVQSSLLQAESLSSKSNCEESMVCKSPNNQVPKKENVGEHLKNDSQVLTTAIEEKCLPFNLSPQEEMPMINVTQNNEQGAHAYDEFLKNFGKSLQKQITLIDVEEKAVEMDEETKLLMNLNSFLVSNHEEFRLKLEDEFGKYDSNTSFTKPKDQGIKLAATDNVCDVKNNNLDTHQNNHDSESNSNCIGNLLQSHNNDGENLLESGLRFDNSEDETTEGIIFHDYLKDSNLKEENTSEMCEKQNAAQIPDELDEETKLLLSLNSFLVSNHEEYRLKLEDEFEKYDNALMEKSRERGLKFPVENESTSVNSCNENIHSSVPSYGTNEIETSNEIFNESNSVNSCDKYVNSNIDSCKADGVESANKSTSCPDQVKNSACPDDTTQDVCSNHSLSEDEKQLKQNNGQNKSKKDSAYSSDKIIISSNSCKPSNEATQTVNGSELFTGAGKDKENVQNNFVPPNDDSTSLNKTPADAMSRGFMTDTTSKRNKIPAMNNEKYINHVSSSGASSLSSSFQNGDFNNQLRVKREEHSASSASDDELSNESSSSSRNYSGMHAFQRHSMRSDNMTHNLAYSKHKSGCSVKQNERLASSSNYDTHLRQWWKPNTRMAIKYLEYQNFMRQLIHQSKC